MKKLFYFIIFTFLFCFSNAYAVDDFYKLNLFSGYFVPNHADNFYSYITGGSGNFYIGVDSNHIVIGEDPNSNYIIVDFCQLSNNTITINSISNVYGNVSIQGANIYNSLNKCTINLAGTTYHGYYSYWVFPVISSWYNMNDGTYNNIFNVNISSSDMGIRAVSAWVNDIIPQEIITSYNAYLTNTQSITNTQNIINNNNSNSNTTNNNINNIDNTINNSTVADPDNMLSNMQNNLASNSVISDLLLLPVTFYQNILNNINTTCSSYNIGSIFNTNLVLPCKNINDLFGSTISSIIDVGLCGIFVLSIRKKFISIFENITSLNDRGNELE